MGRRGTVVTKMRMRTWSTVSGRHGAHSGRATASGIVRPAAGSDRDLPGDLLQLIQGAPGVMARIDPARRSTIAAQLQHAAGNRATRELLGSDGGADAGPLTPADAPAAAPARSITGVASARPGLLVAAADPEATGIAAGASHASPASPPAGVQQIRELPLGAHAAGYTSIPAPAPPELATAQPERRGNGWVARVRPTSVGSDAPVSLYPGDGLHDVAAGPTGQQRHVDVSPDLSELIRKGEEEHLLDLEWIRHLTYDRAAAAVNAVAGGEPPIVDSPAAAARAAADQVRQALPPQLRWPEGEDPFRRWAHAYGRLVHATVERDESGWHNVASAAILDPGEKRKLGVSEQDEVLRYVDRSQIGKHPSAALVRARFSELGSG